MLLLTPYRRRKRRERERVELRLREGLVPSRIPQKKKRESGRHLSVRLGAYAFDGLNFGR